MLRRIFWAAGTLAAVAGGASANVTLGPLFGDGCVLQQAAPIHVFGTAAPGEKVMVSLAGKKAETTTSANGEWTATLPAMNAGGPYSLQVQGQNKLTVKDVLVGEVWVCSGQSNMEWNMGGLGTDEGKADVASSTDGNLRMFTVPKTIRPAPLRDVTGGSWQSASPQNTGNFSAVAYYFGRALRKARKVPIGLIHTSWGGTPIEAWTSKETLMAQGVPVSAFTAPDPNSPQLTAAREAWRKQQARYVAAGSPNGVFNDPGIGANAQGWEKADYDDSAWGSLNTPGKWETSDAADLGNVDGGVWFRKTVEIPEGAAGKAATLTLGAIDDLDTTYVNGVRVGATGLDTPNYYAYQRRYAVPAGVLKAGKNVIAVRTWDTSGDGGFVGPVDALSLTPDGGAAVPLAGSWRYKPENTRPGAPGAEPGSGTDPNKPAVLYNGMFAPVARYTFRGALWYQGESNAGNSMAYRRQLPDMIADWRRDEGRSAFPFFAVQLAPFMAIKAEPSESGWAGLREAQSHTAYTVPNVGVAVITDVGDEKDIHPRRKAPVGERLALLARHIAYNERIAAESPRYKAMKAQNGSAVLTFDNVGGGLVATPTDTAGKPVTGGKLVGFAVAGPDGKFVNADASITGKNEVTVRAPQVSDIRAVRFGWADYPVVNLWSRDGLPADPFRTDAPR